ncbi:MAG: hypothetical protein QME68_07820, partial [Elusimicrobiota bacterium]|nr:hypothetical protein [Elusimicrobiota bacterium]
MENFNNNFRNAVEKKTPTELLLLALNRAYYLEKPPVIDILTELSELCSVEFSTEVSSVSIGFKNNKFYLWFNREFVKEYISTPDCLLFVVLHELLHKAYGDLFKQFDKLSYNHTLANISFDMIIDRKLCQEFFSSPVPILEKLYRNKGILLRILTPPEFLVGTNQERFSQEKLLEPVNKYPDSIKNLVIELYTANWFNNCTVTVVYELLVKLWFSLGNRIKTNYIVQWLIGEHYSVEETDWIKWLRKKFHKYRFVPGYSRTKKEFLITVQPKKSKEFYQVVIKALSSDTKHSVLKEQLLPEIGFIPFLKRKETFMLAYHWQPIFYPNPVVQREFCDWKTHLYIDVSHSTSDYWDILYGLIIALKDNIG